MGTEVVVVSEDDTADEIVDSEIVDDAEDSADDAEESADDASESADDAIIGAVVATSAADEAVTAASEAIAAGARVEASNNDLRELLETLPERIALALRATEAESIESEIVTEEVTEDVSPSESHWLTRRMFTLPWQV